MKFKFIKQTQTENTNNYPNKIRLNQTLKHVTTLSFIVISILSLNYTIASNAGGYNASEVVRVTTATLNVRDNSCKKIGSVKLNTILSITKDPTAKNSITCLVEGKKYIFFPISTIENGTTLVGSVASDYIEYAGLNPYSLNNTQLLNVTDTVNIRDNNCQKTNIVKKEFAWKAPFYRDPNRKPIYCLVKNVKHIMIPVKTNMVQSDNKDYISAQFLKKM